ncbi:MAG TPA: flagellar biosynthesis protein FlhA [Bryobacteraceae bacterium]|nr:flagellar biosynthesis protein FlhA [Bryobacteraceae bacterium]
MTPAATVAAPRTGATRRISAATFAEFTLPLAIFALIIALITPMPGFLLDFLIVVDIMLSVTVLMVSIYLTKPADFNVYPTTLLLMTLFRLALNVSSSRLILLNGNSGTSAAGEVIESFGNFVVGGNYIIGAVIFLILIAIQYVVINHGAVRISEVTARFTLDALPGKQMSIDSDLNAGLIDETQARERRKALAAEAEFYGAMDGASRFTQRDAMASILITSINIVAGFLIGVFQHGMDLTRAIQTYTILTIGDGLVTVIPALMISVSGAMIITRANSETKLGMEFRNQLFGKWQPLAFTSGVLIALAAFPGLPKLSFLLLGSGAGAVAWRMRQSSLTAPRDAAADAAAQPAEKDRVDDLLKVDTLTLEVGLGLVRFVEGGSDSPLLRRIGAIRRQLAADLGYILPAVRLKDNLSLKAHEYTICLKGIEISRYEIPAGCEMAIAVGKPTRQMGGIATREPAFGIQALWIPAEQSDAARDAGYTVVDPVTVMGTHISEFVRRYAHEMLSRNDVKKILDRVSADNQKLVEDLIPKMVPVSIVQRVFQNLLRERVSVRDAVSIFEAMAEAASGIRNPILLTEFIRQSIRRTIVKPFINKSGELPAYFLDASTDRAITNAVQHGDQTSQLSAPQEMMTSLIEKVEAVIPKTEAQTVMIVGSGARYFIRQILESRMPSLSVISHNEVPPELSVVSLGVI